MNHREITYACLGDKLVEVMPELKARYQAELDWWEGDPPGAHNIFGHQLLLPYIDSLLAQPGNDEKLRRLFDFLEVLAGHPDKDVRDVVATTVMSSICGDDARLEAVRKFLGERTLEVARSLRGDTKRGGSG